MLLKDDRIFLDIRRLITRNAREKLRYNDHLRRILGEKYTLLTASFWQKFFVVLLCYKYSLLFYTD